MKGKLKGWLALLGRLDIGCCGILTGWGVVPEDSLAAL